MSATSIPSNNQEQYLEFALSANNALSGTEESFDAHSDVQHESDNEPSTADGDNASPIVGAVASKDQSDNENGLSNLSDSPSVSIERTYTCHKCEPPKAFHKKHQLTTHQRRHDPPFRCDQLGCSKRFQYRKDLTRHLKTKHDLDSKCFPCPVPSCEWSLERGHKGFTRPDTLLRHTRKVHKTLSESPSGDTS